MGSKRLADETVNKLLKEFDSLRHLPDDHITKFQVDVGDLFFLLESLKFDTSCRFDLLMDLTAVDYTTHFTMVYVLYSLPLGHRVMVKCDIPRINANILSISRLYAAADVMEREAYDLMGIDFVGHPNLKRILLADDFVGHPLRKDYTP